MGCLPGIVSKRSCSGEILARSSPGLGGQGLQAVQVWIPPPLPPWGGDSGEVITRFGWSGVASRAGVDSPPLLPWGGGAMGRRGGGRGCSVS